MTTRWMYLSDLAPQGNICNLKTGEVRSINSAAVVDRAPIGLRRYTLDELPGGVYKETGDYLPLTPDMVSDLEDNMRIPNSWNYDWPHLQVECDGDDPDSAVRAAIVERLTREMSDHPYTFELVALQRRFLMYYSDGDRKTQQSFERYVPRPDSPPYRRDGALRKKYNWVWNSIMRDAKVPVPKAEGALYGSLAPCLYTGPAWVVRFRLDGQDPLLERCRVYVTDEGEFICSDWCQRHDQTSYGDGINLQRGIYSFGAWVAGPCVTFATGRGGFTPTSTTFTRTAVKDLVKRHGLIRPVRVFDDVFADAQQAVASFGPTAAADGPKLPHDAGPITAEAVAEAEAAGDARLEAVGDTLPLPSGVIPQTLRATGLRFDAFSYHPVDLDHHQSGAARSVVGFQLRPDGGVIVVRVTTTMDLSQEAYEAIRLGRAPGQYAHVAVNAEHAPGSDAPEFWYLGEGLTPVTPMRDALNKWWAYDAAVYFRDVLAATAAVAA